MKTFTIAIALSFIINVLTTPNGLAQEYKKKNIGRSDHAEINVPKNKFLFYARSLVKRDGSKPLAFSYERSIYQFGDIHTHLIILGCLYERNESVYMENKSYVNKKFNKMVSWRLEPFIKLHITAEHNANLFLYTSFFIGNHVIDSEYTFDTVYYDEWWLFYPLPVKHSHYTYFKNETQYYGIGTGIGFNFDLSIDKGKSIRISFDVSLKYRTYWFEYKNNIPSEVTAYNEEYQQTKTYHLSDRGKLYRFSPYFGIGLKF